MKNNAVNAPAAAGRINGGNSFCRIALNIPAVYAIQEPLHVKTGCSAESAGTSRKRPANPEWMPFKSSVPTEQNTSQAPEEFPAFPAISAL